MSNSKNDLAERAVDLAAQLLEEARRHQTAAGRARARQLQRMMADPAGKAFTLALADQVFRSPNSRRGAEQFRHLLAHYGVPVYLKRWERAALRMAAFASQIVPWIVMPAVREKVRFESRDVILSAELRPLTHYLDERRAQGVRLNLNLLGEAVLGEKEASHRLDSVIRLLARPDIAYLSVKISAVFSQINVLAFEQTLSAVEDRLRILYRAALAHRYRDSDGRETPKFVNLDMEEYRDLELTAQAFCKVLDEKKFRELPAGIVLQAYLPDSFRIQQRLTAWAQKRVDSGGAAIKLRIVKGANLAMEQVDASVHGWPQAPYGSKAEVDANYKRMVAFGMTPENAAAVRLGVASHNLFDLAWSLLLREQNGVEDQVEFEMLEGMANHQATAIRERAGGLLFYAPIVYRRNFVSAIAYLVRRLDENTAPQNFLHDLFGLEPGSPAWDSQRKRFLEACRAIDLPATHPNRIQNRATEARVFDPDQPFENEPDTDWTLTQNRDWIAPILERWQSETIPPVPLQIGGKEIHTGNCGEGLDPSRPELGTLYDYALAGPDEIEKAIATAESAQKSWGAKPIADRSRRLAEVAGAIARGRGEAIGCLVLDGGKAVPEADGEISEAIDFANYYARGLDFVKQTPGLENHPRGVVVVTPPWNFPFAIPASGILAALMAGNSVILKPAPETVLTGWMLAQFFWEAGIPKNVLQFVPCPDNEIGRALITDDRVGAVVLTGAYETARMFQGWKPELPLFAETSGKNALYISSAADADLAIHDLVHAAFGHSGQKCSAASLAIVEDELYDTASFCRQLRDAAASLAVGHAWDLRSVVTPLIRPPGPELLRGLTRLDSGEEWLLKPRRIHDCLWSPGIRLGVKPGSWFHRTECFGPVLGVIRARDLEEALAIQNSGEFALTAGIHSLDQREVREWRERIEAGNAYTNRKITGAIVRRQPFGGWKHSSVGPGAKAGGPNYVAAFCHWSETALPDRQSKLSPETESLVSQLGETLDADKKLWLATAAVDFEFWWREEFGRAHDPSQTRGETNAFRYRPCRGVVSRLEGSSRLVDIAVLQVAAALCGTPIRFSVESDPGVSGAIINVETPREFLARVPKYARSADRIRIPNGAGPEHFAATFASGIFLDDSPVLAHGRIELPKFLREQSISDCVHRYGNVVDHEDLG